MQSLALTRLTEEHHYITLCSRPTVHINKKREATEDVYILEAKKGDLFISNKITK